MVKKKTTKKKSKGFKISRRAFWTSVVVLVVVAAAIIILANLGYEKEVKEEFEELGIGDPDIYYAELVVQCEDLPVTQKGCCIESANIMKKWLYPEPVAGVCPEGTELNTISNCPGAYSWCE